MSKPATYNFPDHYRNDGVIPFTIGLRYKTGVPLDLTGCSVRMQLRTSRNVVAWEFSTADGADGLLTVLDGGIIQFPRIISWNIPVTKYYYDLEVTDSTGFTQTYLSGTWQIKEDKTI